MWKGMVVADLTQQTGNWLNELEYYEDLHEDSMPTEMRSIALHSPAALGHFLMNQSHLNSSLRVVFHYVTDFPWIR
jgi:hypothetical protein